MCITFGGLNDEGSAGHTLCPAFLDPVRVPAESSAWSPDPSARLPASRFLGKPTILRSIGGISASASSRFA